MQITKRTVLCGFVGLLSVLGCAILAPAPVLGQPATIKIIAIEGARSRQQVLDKNGQMIEVMTPSQWPANIQADKLPLGGVGGRQQTVSGTVASITAQQNPPQTSWMKVITAQGQVITFEVPTASLAGTQVGEHVTLQLP